ncbi:uncharacterized protein LOC126324517 isoform X2 [Schistocerca gregaria]|uniref:uncharacterized protein LOC126324517 isoform X2 n=1 Tax=Schistocerca gregaria TaxID=7010 RepID=UPI00211EBB79|nr:uncharacterized protein LOC126324517 isoform X2 [Schistocerca gregaria]
MESKGSPNLIDRRVDEFSKERPSVEEIASFLSLDCVVIPLERPYIWSNTVVSLDGVCSIGQGKRGVRLIGLHHLSDSQGSTDFKLLSAGWASSDAIIFSAAGLRTECEQKLLVVQPDLLNWRMNTLKRQSRQPSVIVVTKSGWLDIKHPIWSTDRLKIIATSCNGKKAIHKYLLNNEKELSNDAGRISLWLKEKYNIIIKSFPDTQNENSVDLVKLCTYLKVVHSFRYLDISAGPTLINLFLKNKLIDECRYTRSGVLVGQHPWGDCEGVEGPDKRPLQYPASIICLKTSNLLNGLF